MMRTLFDLGFPMTDGALSRIPSDLLAEALLNQACAYYRHHKPLKDVPCWVFRELGLGMDFSLQFVLLEYPDDAAGTPLQTREVTNAQAYRLIERYRSRHDPYYMATELEHQASYHGGVR
ncbi:MAG: hypothetical protein J5I53_09015 [Bradyrhizobiaceae bacterium]|nr:hypothetical protein [Bradyrhizobiaceae bacterium]